MDAHTIGLLTLALAVAVAGSAMWSKAKTAGEVAGSILTEITRLRGEVNVDRAATSGALTLLTSEVAHVRDAVSSAHKRIDGVADMMADRTPMVPRRGGSVG